MVPNSEGSTVRFRSVALAAVLALLVAAVPGPAAERHDVEAVHGRSLDMRITINEGVRVEPLTTQHEALARLKTHMPDLTVRFEPTTGVTRTLSRPVGHLTGVQAGAPRALALAFVNDHLDALGLDEEDVSEKVLTDEVVSSVTGSTHLYWNQLVDGIPVYNAQLQVNVDRDGRIMAVNNAFVPGIRGLLNERRAAVSAARAVQAAARSIGLEVRGLPQVLSQDDDARRTTVLDGTGLSLEPITAQLSIVPVNGAAARLAWRFMIQTLDQQHAFDFHVDAVQANVWTRLDLVSDAQYRVFPQPDESPLHGSTTHTLVTDPQNNATNASPNGWHSTGSSSFTILRGNNVHSYHDRDGNNSPPSSQPGGGSSLVFDFSANLSLDPSNYISAAVTNLFYWNNVIHDVQYQHGFTESAGNFQVNNFGRGGNGNDDVRAEAQDNADGSSRCNANFFTPTDGSRPRMQMFVCNQVSPQRDGDFDNGVIVHEYGHGISIRQVGGPSNSSCLGNSQQPGEGWSDWFGLAYTHEVGDAGTDNRGIGTYLFGQGPNGPGIRDLPYSTSNSINNWTYQSIGGASIPHGVGSRWAQAIWEVYWALVAKHGFDPNLYTPGSAPGAAGNLRALTYVNEGLKNTACSPTFLDARDGIIQAATNLHGGEDVCDIWQAFADFGLGTNATTGGSNSTSATNGFDVPSECGGTPPPPDPTPGSCPAGSIDFTSFGLSSYGGQNVSNNVSVADGGDTLVLRDNTWVRSTQTFNVTSSTVVELLFAGGPQGEIHAIGLDENNTLNDNPRHFVLWGTQNWTGAGNAGPTSPQYSGSGSFESFTVPVGQSYTGTMNLVFTNDNDGGSGNEGRFACVRVVDDAPPPPTGNCTVDDDFSGGAAGWFNDGASTCSTGAYVLGTPTQQTSTVVTQPGGDHTTGSGNAIFTATNTSAGSNDVDGGNCILGSPTWNVANASTLRVWYFHGQRDSGDDPSGDFFRLEVSTNGGASFSPIVSIGDTRTTASWTEATAQIPAGSSVQLRVQASDGSGPGDIVEGGIDDLSICDN